VAISTPVSLATLFDTAPASAAAVLASMTFTSGRLYLFSYMLDRTTPGDPSTGFSMTHGATNRTASWHYVTHVAVGTSRFLVLYWYIAVATETVTFTYTPPGATPNSLAYAMDEVASGFNSTTPIRQSNSNTGAAISTISVVLGSAPLTGNAEMSFVGSRAASGAVTQRTNWTELSEVLGSGTTTDSGGLEVQYVFDPNLETTASVSASGNRTFAIIAIEIAAAGGTVFSATLSGAITPAGTLVKSTSRALAGAITPAGTLVKKLTRALTGAITPAGALVSTKLVVKTVSGAITPAGALVNKTVKVLAGAVTPAGALLKQLSRALSGQTTPAGALTKQTSKPLAGSITPAGGLVKRTTKVLAGALTPSGVLAAARLAFKALAGAITPGPGTTVGTFQAGTGSAPHGKETVASEPVQSTKLT
jgi:hypothetical protein